MQWAPCAERGGSRQSLALGRTASQAGEVGLHGGLVDKDESLWSFAHRRDAVIYPLIAGATDAGFASLICDRVAATSVFFCT